MMISSFFPGSTPPLVSYPVVSVICMDMTRTQQEGAGSHFKRTTRRRLLVDDPAKSKDGIFYFLPLTRR